MWLENKRTWLILLFLAIIPGILFSPFMVSVGGDLPQPYVMSNRIELDINTTSGFNLSEIPIIFNNQVFNGQLGMLWVSQIMLAGLVLLAVSLPLTISRLNPMGSLMITIITLIGLMAIGWIPSWVFLILCLIVAGLWGTKMRDMLPGG